MRFGFFKVLGSVVLLAALTAPLAHAQEVDPDAPCGFPKLKLFYDQTRLKRSITEGRIIGESLGRAEQKLQENPNDADQKARVDHIKQQVKEFDEHQDALANEVGMDELDVDYCEFELSQGYDPETGNRVETGQAPKNVPGEVHTKDDISPIKGHATAEAR